MLGGDEANIKPCTMVGVSSTSSVFCPNVPDRVGWLPGQEFKKNYTVVDFLLKPKPPTQKNNDKIFTMGYG